MPVDHGAELKKVRTFPSLIKYLREEMGWPIDSSNDFETLTFDYTPEELGIDTVNAAKIQEIKRLRPLASGQPWGIFFVKFEPKRLPVVALRRILSRVVVKKRASANSAERAAWAPDDLLFVSNFGEGETRQITFAHFSQHESKDDLPTLKVLGWDNRDTPLHLDHVATQLTQRLAWPEDDGDAAHWRASWRSAFTLRHREVISTSKALAERLAELARAIRNRLRTVLAIETKNGPITGLMKAFREALIHDLNADSFADMYAQTIAYGLLSARVTNPKANTAEGFTTQLPVTNPFLKELMATFLRVGGRKASAGRGVGIDFDELGVSEVVELLDDANMEAVVRDFGDKNPQEDPVIHFYELFLKEYDAKERIKRGVFYTPRAVVSYIVRSVHELLQTEFGLPDGLADTATWGDVLDRNEGLTIPHGLNATDRFVTLLDPATGTGTFLVEAIEIIHRTLVQKWRHEGRDENGIRQSWNEYVPRHLLPRLHGFELLMAPYAIAHLKIGLKLHETGYRFDSDERARVFLTNALEPAHDFSARFAYAALEHEAEAVNEIKRKQRFTVVFGNPPYSVNSANKDSPMDAHLAEYKRDLVGERNLKPLNDDYVKFVRFSHMTLRATGCGLLGMITNHSYTTARLFRAMRRSLLAEFQGVRFLDLRGDMGRDPRMATDENVFEIQQGVGIAILSRTSSTRTMASRAHRYELTGDQQSKCSWLGGHSCSSTPWVVVEPLPPLYGFGKVEQEVRGEYEAFLAVNRAFDVGNVGYQTHRDEFVIDFTVQEVISRVAAFREARGSEAELAKRFGIKGNRDWSVVAAHKSLVKDADWEKLAQRTLYRPFDLRHIVYASYLIDYDRRDLMVHMSGGNRGLLVSKVFDEHEFTSVLATKWIVESKAADRTRGSHLFPLRVAAGAGQMRLGSPKRGQWASNLTGELLGLLKQRLGISVCLNDASTEPAEVTDWEIFGYMYGILHSPEYRARYYEFLKDDFPRVPIPTNLDLLCEVARLGNAITALHLMESPKLEDVANAYSGPRNPKVARVGWSNDTVWLDAARAKRGADCGPGTIGFRGVTEAVWSFHIGGYQVCERWLTERKGRTLSKADVSHYERIIIAVAETISLMSEIDEVIDRHGGWPDAFQAPTRTAEARIVPFRPRVVEPKQLERYVTCVPLIALKAAAGVFGDPQRVEDNDFEWVALNTRRRLRPGMFVAQVVGKSMEPAIPDGSYCLFVRPVSGSRQGKTVLVQLRDGADSETGERYTVKRYESEKALVDGSWRHTKVTLKPNNPAFAPIELLGADEGEVAVIAEFVEVLGATYEAES